LPRVLLVQFQKDVSHSLLINRPRLLWGRPLGMWLLNGFEIFMANEKSQRADFEAVAFVELDLALDPLGIDERAVGAFAIPNRDLVILGQKLAVAMADVRIGCPKLAFVVSSNKEGSLLNGNDHPLALAPINHKSPFHVAPPRLW
jgi:hypothetical protein